MSVLMIMKWPEITPDVYEGLRKAVDWEKNPPKGLKFHTIAFDNGAHIVDLWDDAEDFKSFGEHRLMPAVTKLGIKAEPKIEFHPSYAVFTNGLNNK